MALNNLQHALFLLLVALATSHIANASDPDITSDFIIPPSINDVDGNFFTYTGMQGILDADTPATFNVTKATMAELPALNGQSVSSAVLRYPAGGSVNPATAIFAFGSASAGTVSVPSSIFASGIDDAILAKSFKTDVATIQKIKAGLAPKA